ncbi:hypothetical protein ABTX77_27630 [Streptomyces sp. NPDC097704]|uniref:hypothetical protein n=1 Tax=Streptomyces sp. NPDC097704 TaxID=3157101 RepID=UPI003317987C
MGPLHEAGFRVVALDHHGNNFVDGYEPEGFLHVWERPRHVSFVLDVLAREQPLGPVGAAGFSLGGHTAAALAGVRVGPRILRAVMTGAVPLPEIPESWRSSHTKTSSCRNPPTRPSAYRWAGRPPPSSSGTSLPESRRARDGEAQGTPAFHAEAARPEAAGQRPAVSGWLSPPRSRRTPIARTGRPGLIRRERSGRR